MTRFLTTRSYYIIPVNRLKQSMINLSLETSWETLRFSKDGKYCILKFDNDIASAPPQIANIPGNSVHSHQQVLDKMAEIGWDYDPSGSTPPVKPPAFNTP